MTPSPPMKFSSERHTRMPGAAWSSPLITVDPVVVMPDTEPAIAEKVAERIRAEIEQTPFLLGKSGQSINVTVSVGVSSMRRGADSVEDLMKRADLALYEAKTGGRNRVVAKAA